MQQRVRHHRIHLYPYAFSSITRGNLPFVTPNPTPLARSPHKTLLLHPLCPLRKIRLITQTPTVQISPLASWRQ